ncbi:unnamed protein product [Prunus armeniaca]
MRPYPIEPPPLPLPSPTKLSHHHRQQPPENAENSASFDRFSHRSFSLDSPPNRTSERRSFDSQLKFHPVLRVGFRPLPATFWGRSKNKSGYKLGVLPKLGVWAGDLEFFRPPEISQATQDANACGGAWAVWRGLLSVS